MPTRVLPPRLRDRPSLLPDGSAAAGQELATEDVYPDSLAEQQMAARWRFADQLVQRLGGLGDLYITVLVEGGRFPRRRDPVAIVMRRGPVLPGVDDEHVAASAEN